VTDLAERMAECARAIEAELGALLPPAEGPEARLLATMRYATLEGGKRLRPFLVMATGELCGARPGACRRVGAAIELVHCYSLIHDDLPAMDAAELRRGRPACHRRFDEATAILAGDALQALAFAALAQDDYGVDDSRRATLVAGLAAAAGHAGMCGGQMIDLASERRPQPLATIERLQRLKTGALLAFAVDAGWILGGAGPAERRALAGYARDLGLAFQIRDDLLDVEGETAAIGKDRGLDAAAGKATFVAALGVAGARARLAELRTSGARHLDNLARDATLLRELLDFVIDRGV
jgi:farnesyl diphosphate synthase